ncbi:flagellar biosynthetic protein FliO [Guptibacillus algicola]|uniref:flagellar biosynthetic protein FliO n=1 Tax=Guptibacillus algicola TaxID=225844 RepID=UPI001CD24583|nr:flagellar biosynthetic protein FliO [Alkalihalobacillus algicola]MCA0988919.1 flagellar biosynthetic protein FliO [Alkalihalobacillus algicola]
MRQRYLGIMALMLLLSFFVTPHHVEAVNGSVTDWLTEDGEKPAEEKEEQPAVETKNSNIFVLLLKLVFYTVVVVGLIYLLIRFLAKRQQKMQQHSIFTPLGGTPLGNNKSVQMIKAGNSVYMLGVGEDINLLKEIKDEEEMKVIMAHAEEQKTVPFLNRKQSEDLKDMFQSSLNRQRSRRSKWQQDMDNNDPDKRDRL